MFVASSVNYVVDLSGKYIKDGEEVQSSAETLAEETQAKLWELSARLVRLEGYEPLEVTPPAPEEPTGKDKGKKEKKAKKENVAGTDKPDENVVVENGHAVENETEKCDEGKEKGDSENTKDEQTNVADKIEDEAKNDESATANEKQETPHTNGDCKIPAEDHTTAAEPNKQEAQKVEVNGVGDCNTE